MCSAVLYLSCMACDLKKCDELIVPSQTHVAKAHAVKLTGAMPVFCDVDKITGLIEPEEIKKKITKKTKAIRLINALGNCCDLFKIKKIAKKNNLIIFEDNCESLGSKFKNKNLGTFGDFSTFSFFYSHQITSGEGGMVTCNNKEDYEILFSED